ncbi:MAG: hypothetical protein Q8O43_00800 [Dehalococcoidia bacterium]|nr:hypothetical protein [Dehalococcoidia bacterium]
MGDIKSAFEIAMEKISKIEEATLEERLKWKFFPKGEQLAAKYLKEDVNLLSELNNYKGDDRMWVTQGAVDVLARSIDLPKNDATKKTNRKAMDGLKLLKKDKSGVENLYSKIRYVFNHYTEQGEQQRKQAYEQLKVQFAAKLQQAMQQQLGTSARVNMRDINIERHPQFLDEWRRVQGQLEAQYIEHLNEYRKELIEIP